jgi:hypothetical protein
MVLFRLLPSRWPTWLTSSFSAQCLGLLIHDAFCGIFLFNVSIGYGQSAQFPDFGAPTNQQSIDWNQRGVSINSVVNSFVGSRSCAASSCHGDPRRESVVGASAHYFFDRDKHQLAGTVLRNQRSHEIVDRLGLKCSPWEAQECLACHAPGAVNAPDRNFSSAMISEGVGCESCHGPARDWLVVHREVQWKRSEVWSSTRKAEARFVENSSLSLRIDRCADCHVGNSSQSVTHDLIAAGHPRLAFEFSAYQSRMPIHWRRTTDRRRNPIADHLPSPDRSSSEAANWFLGQVINADHELQILATALIRPDARGPELAQYDCFACHHKLSSPSWQRARLTHNLHSGELPWGTWHLGLIAETQPSIPEILGEQYVIDLKSLRHEMKSLPTDPQVVAPLVQSLQNELASARSRLADRAFSARELSAVQNCLLAKSRVITEQGWDGSTQLFLAVIAFDKGINDANGLGNRVTLDRVAHFEKLRDLLSFNNAQNPVPRYRLPESPANFELNLREVQEEFEHLQSVSGTFPQPILPGQADIDTIPPLPTLSVPEND